MPLYVEDFANTLESLDLSMPVKAGRGTLPLYVEDFALYDHKRSVTSPLYVEVFATTLGSLFRIALRTTYRAPLRGGLCQNDSYRQNTRKKGVPSTKIDTRKANRRGPLWRESPRDGSFKPQGMRVPRRQVRQTTHRSLRRELFT